MLEMTDMDENIERKVRELRLQIVATDEDAREDQFVQLLVQLKLAPAVAAEYIVEFGMQECGI